MTADHQAAVEKDAAQWKHCAIQLEKNTAKAKVKKLYLQKQPDDVIQAAIQRARTANYELNKIQQLEKAGLSSSTPDNPHIVRVLNRLMPIGCATQTQDSSAVQLTFAPGVKRTSAPPDRHWSVEAEIASVYRSGNTHNRDPIMCMICATLDNNKDMNLDNSIIVKMKLNIASPEEYSGSLYLKVYETFVARIMRWLKMNGLLSTKHATFQV